MRANARTQFAPSDGPPASNCARADKRTKSITGGDYLGRFVPAWVRILPAWRHAGELWALVGSKSAEAARSRPADPSDSTESCPWGWISIRTCAVCDRRPIRRTVNWREFSCFFAAPHTRHGQPSRSESAAARSISTQSHRICAFRRSIQRIGLYGHGIGRRMVQAVWFAETGPALAFPGLPGCLVPWVPRSLHVAV